MSAFLEITRMYLEKDKEVKLLSNPKVDFNITEIASVHFTNLRIFDETKRFKEQGEAELIVNFEIKNTRALKTVLHFQIKDISTDLPITNESDIIPTLAKPTIASRKPKVLDLDASEHTSVILKAILPLQLHPIDTNLPLIGTANHLRVLILVSQTDKVNGELEIPISVPEPADKIREQIISQLKHRLELRQDIATTRDHPSKDEIIEYFRLLWNNTSN